MEKIKWYKFVFAFLAFWFLMFFGGSVLLIWNALSPSFSQYREGDLGYTLIQIATTPVGAYLAYSACNHITEGKHHKFVVVNCVLAAMLVGILIFTGIAYGSSTISDIISFVITVIVLVYIISTTQGEKG